MDIRIGNGYDVHRMVSGRPCMIGGVNIPHHKGTLGHSDGDPLIHAICDALLGSLALGDIGGHFPDKDPAYLDVDSLKLLDKVCKLLEEKGWFLVNLDATIVAQAPKMAPFIHKMRENIAKSTGSELSQISVKATTEEGLGFTGREEGIGAWAIVLVGKKRSDFEKAFRH